VPTPNDIIAKMCKMAKVTKNDTVFDLGCGKAEMLIEAVKQFNAKKGVGIDINPEILEGAKKNVKEAGLTGKIELKLGDMLKTTEKDMEDADVVLLYIGDDLGKRLSPVLRKALKPGARVVSHRFTLGDWTPTERIRTRGEDGDNYDLLLWVVPEKK
jgi:cyclopropane fatty-acyl-phospholipid synthase-like methyltransferase